MTYQADNNVVETVVQLLCENGLSYMADAMRLMLNEAMRLERSRRPRINAQKIDKTMPTASNRR